MLNDYEGRYAGKIGGVASTSGRFDGKDSFLEKKDLHRHDSSDGDFCFVASCAF